MMLIILYVFFAFLVGSFHCLIDLEDHFGKCQLYTEEFDDCVKESINDLRPYFKEGFPQYGILPFDPFHADQIPLRRSGPFYNFQLILRNVTESGWTASHITHFKSNLSNNSIKYTQFFPDKYLKGEYEFQGKVFGRWLKNQGTWDLGLFDYTQTTTIVRKSNGLQRRQAEPAPIKVNVEIQTCKRLELHIGNLAGGRSSVERVLDWIINRAWQPGFVILTPLINELVSTAFTEIFNKNFESFPFERIFPANRY